MQVWNVLHAARWKYRTQKIAICAPSHNLVGMYFCNQGMNRQSERKLVKQQYLLQMSPQYGELQSTSGWDRFVSLGHTSKFQRVSRLAFVTAVTSLTRYNQTLHDVCPSPGLVYYMYIFGGSCPLTEFCLVVSSFFISSPNLSGRRLDVYHTSTHGVALVWI